MSMNRKRKSSLIHLAYESGITNNIKLDKFVEVFKNKHSRYAWIYKVLYTLLGVLAL